MATRRCTQRELLLRPDVMLNSILGYLLGYVQARFQFAIHFFVAMSNHLHGGFSDPRSADPRSAEAMNRALEPGRPATSHRKRSAHREVPGTCSQLPAFMRDFLAFSARAINVLRRRKGNLWEAGGDTYNFVLAPSTEDKIRRLIYGLSNPVTAGLVHDHRKWPGLMLDPGPSGRRVYRFQKPRFFFSKRMPEYTEVVVTAPETELSPQEFMHRVYQGVNEAEAAERGLAKVKGRTFLGAKGVLAQNPTARPATYEHWRQAQPQISTVDLWRRLEWRQRNHAFLAAYAESRDRFVAGDREVLFPIGTYLLVVQYGARSRRSEPPEAKPG